MGSIGKSFALILILIIAMSSLGLLMVKPASAQTAPPSAGIPTPSVPTFTLKFIQSSYEETTTNPYTGVNSTQQVNNNTIEVIIKNQPFTSYIDASTNTTVSLWYNVQVKGHFGETWTMLYYISDDTSPRNLPMQSASEDTVISTPQDDYPAGGQIDFQVEAIIGTFLPLTGTQIGSFYYETSGWSNTQTLTIPQSSTSPTPTVPEFPSLPILSMLMSISTIVFFTIAIRKRHRSISTKS